MESFKTPDTVASAKLVVKRSEFIAKSMSVDNAKEATKLINDIKAAHWDAKHNCYAFVLRDGFQKYSDDSEPSGTAGAAILDVINGEGVKDCLIVVTRYFGGILLGTGGLTRAYSSVAKEALKASGTAFLTLCEQRSISCSYSFYKILSKLLEKYNAVTTDINYSDNVNLIFSIEKSKSDNFVKELADLSAGKIDAGKISESFVKINK